MRARTYTAAWGVLSGELVEQARIDVDQDGRIVRCGSAASLSAVPPADVTRDFGPSIVVPGFVNAHSHAFQRAIRGRTHRRGIHDPSSFWSWREAMYGCANALTPETLQDITTRAFAEMVRAGITCVGEFHYVHHQPGGTPYDDPNELSWRVIEAARTVGIRLVLLEVYYGRSGPGAGPLPEQRRFCDGSVQAYLARVDALRSAGVDVGITPHSVRAVGRAELQELVGYARDHALPLHVHVSEQPRENEQCRAEHGMSPLQLLQEVGATERAGAFTAVHAVHIDDADRLVLRGQNVCACPSTEADLGDGVVGASALRHAEVGLALGSDSNAVIDLIQEARLLEMHERLVAQSRLRLVDAHGQLGPALLAIATEGGARALGLSASAGSLSPGHPFDAAVIDLRHPFLQDIEPWAALDGTFASGSAQVVRATIVSGRELEPALDGARGR